MDSVFPRIVIAKIKLLLLTRPIQELIKRMLTFALDYDAERKELYKMNKIFLPF
jgi:hypothetical protein